MLALVSAIFWSISSGAGVQSVAKIPLSNLIQAISTWPWGTFKWILGLEFETIVRVTLAIFHPSLEELFTVDGR